MKKKKTGKQKDMFLKVAGWSILVIMIIFVIVLTIVSGIVTFSESDSGKPWGIPGLKLSIPLFIATVIFLSIIFAITVAFFWKPMNKHLETRRNNIETNIDAASFKNKEADVNLLKSLETGKKAKSNAIEIINISKNEAIEQKREIVQQTKNQTDKLIDDSRIRIKKEKEQMYEDIKQEIISTSLIAAEKILEKNMNTKSNKKMIEELLESLN